MGFLSCGWDFIILDGVLKFGLNLVTTRNQINTMR